MIQMLQCHCHSRYQKVVLFLRSQSSTETQFMQDTLREHFQDSSRVNSDNSRQQCQEHQVSFQETTECTLDSFVEFMSSLKRSS